MVSFIKWNIKLSALLHDAKVSQKFSKNTSLLLPYNLVFLDLCIIVDLFRKQSLSCTIINYIGVAIGMISTLFIYPYDLALYGIYGFLTNTASILTPIVSLGFGVVLLKYFPYFKAVSSSKSRLVSFVICGYTVGIVFFISAFYLLYPSIITYQMTLNQSIVPYLIFIPAFTVLYVIYDVVQVYSLAHFKMIFPTFLANLIKIILPVLFLCVIKGWINPNQFIQALCIHYICIIIALGLSLWYSGDMIEGLDSSFLKLPDMKEMIRFAMYSILGGTSAVIALRIDSMMVTSYLGTEANGTFALAAFISNAAYIPASAISDILNPRIAHILKEDDRDQLKKTYKISMINMLIPTLFLAGCIILGFESLSKIMPQSEKVILAFSSLVFLLFARIVDASTGVNNHILSYSKYYKIEMVLMLIMAMMNVGLNTLLIPKYGMMGAAIATFVSVAGFNICKTTIVLIKLGSHPFDMKWVELISITTLSFLAVLSLPKIESPHYQIIISSISFAIIYITLILWRKISPQLNNLLFRDFEKIMHFNSKS
ncbi:MAG TPA: polysaccharide biosynthesis C-terminal domain-containing protein [Saprospiraceae bacterium]|nr:polysaccharide biosynthesis C-terminal domain-containing protein [Saprospiraceae bacterium]